MATICIRNVGPIRDTGIIPINHIMLIVGEQSTGKSTFLKILCYCRWFEKQVMIGEFRDIEQISVNDFLVPLKQFHKLDDVYFSDSRFSIDYVGDVLEVKCTAHRININKNLTRSFERNRFNSKISYIPAERNLLSVIPSLDTRYRSSTYNNMFNFVMEFEEASESMTKRNPLRLSFTDNMDYYHEGGSDYVAMTNKRVAPLLLEYTSSGVQSALPLNVIVHYLCSEVTGAPSRRTPRALFEDSSRGFSGGYSSNKLNRYLFPQLFIEEPGQHLFPSSQARLIRDIISQFSNAESITHEAGYIVISTHSPYVLSQINVLIKARKASLVNRGATESVIPKECILPLSYYSAYCIDEDGMMHNLLDRRTGLIIGDYLDYISGVTEDELNVLNDIIYGEY